MKINLTKDSINKNNVETVQKKKHEYKLLGSYYRSPGLKLYSYSPIDCSLVEVDIKHSNTIHLIPKNGKLEAVDLEFSKATVDSRFIYFEALNNKSAKNRVKKYRNNLDKLSNMKAPKDGVIKFF